MRIMIETTAPLSATDYQILTLLLERHTAEPPAEGTKAPKITEGTISADKVTEGTISADKVTEGTISAVKVPEVDPATVKAAEEKRRAEAVKAADDAATEDLKAAEDSPEPEQDQPVTEQTMDAAVAEAKKLMQGGNKEAVVKALAVAGAAKVGAIETEGQALAFLAALKG